MSGMYESLMQSLTEEVNDIKEHGRSQGRKTVIEIRPVKTYTADEIKAIRAKTGTTQAVFAKCFGVSKKTVESCEEGVNIPSGPAARLLELLGQNALSVDHYMIAQ